jgi:small conductance mechanosensitive channel
VVIPNGELSNGVLVNNSMKEVRRVDWVFGIGYGDNYDTAKDMIMGFIKADTRILNSPAEPFIALSELADSSVKLVVRVWVKSPDYWGVFFDLNEVYYKNAAKFGINMPFPQMDVHFDKNQLN